MERRRLEYARRQREQRERERQAGAPTAARAERDDDKEAKILAAVHDASGSTITANSRRLRTLKTPAYVVQEWERRLDTQEAIYAPWV